MHACKHVALLPPFDACVERRNPPYVARPVSLEVGLLQLGQYIE